MGFLPILVKSKKKKRAIVGVKRDIVGVVQQTKEFSAEGLLFDIWFWLWGFFDKSRDVDVGQFMVAVSLWK